MSVALREAREIKDERALARTDELTGLPNRRRFITALDDLKNKSAILLLLDLDGFKRVNDTLGHDAGDELLRQISLRFSRQIPKGDLLARLGGDEFGAIIYGGGPTAQIAAVFHLDGGIRVGVGRLGAAVGEDEVSCVGRVI